MSRFQLLLRGFRVRIPVEIEGLNRFNEQCLAAARALAAISPMFRSARQMQGDLFLDLTRFAAEYSSAIPEWYDGKIVAISYERKKVSKS